LAQTNCHSSFRLQLGGGPYIPESQWRSLRTTNAIERMQLEFRRRVKTQAALPQ